MILKISTSIPPSLNAYLEYRVTSNPKNGKLFIKTQKSPKSVKFENVTKKLVQAEILKQKWVKPEKDKYIIVRAIFYFPKHGMDINNHWKIPLDAFKQAGVYHDDSKVIEGARRLYIDAQNPRVEFEIWESEIVGIWDNNIHFEQFKNANCRFCKKNPERCAMITQALENRITGDINLEDQTCNKRNPIVTKL